MDVDQFNSDDVDRYDSNDSGWYNDNFTAPAEEESYWYMEQVWYLVPLLLAVAAQAAALSIGVQSTAHVCRPQLVLSQTPQLCRSTASRHADVLMAVPKKRQSKMKTRQRKANWFAKARRSATLALSRAKSAKYNPLEDPKYAFSSPDDEEEDDEDDDEEE